MKYEELLNCIRGRYCAVLRENLVGIYVHGSIAFGCFNWEKSDIDFIVVVQTPLTVEEKLALLEVLRSPRLEAPEKGFEMSVVLARHCRAFVYPTPYELHYSNGWRERYEKDPLSLCGGEEKCDYDLAAHFTVIRHAGITLFGEAIPAVFGAVPKEQYADSIFRDIANAGEDVEEDPVYIILNLCRVYAYLKDGLVLSKKEGGAWGMRNLPDRYRALVSAMLDFYTDNTPYIPNPELQESFCGYMLDLIATRRGDS